VRGVRTKRCIILERAGSGKTELDDGVPRIVAITSAIACCRYLELHGYLSPLHTRSTGAHVDLPLGSTGDGAELSSRASFAGTYVLGLGGYATRFRK
jgi:hypothetical protein